MPEQEYADFGDMEESPIPDTVDEVNSEDNHLAVQQAEPSDEGQVQTPEEDLSHLVNPDGSIKSEATDEQMEKLGVDNPKSYRYFQSQLHKTQSKPQSNEELQALQREIAELRGQLTPKPTPEQPLVKPQKPSSDDPLDLIKWQSEMFEYQEKLLEKQQQQFQQVSETWQQAEQRRQQEELYAQQKAYHISQLTEKGGIPLDEANEAFAMYSKAQRDPDSYYRDLADFYRFKKGQYATPKSRNMDNRATRQGQVPSLANVPSKTETQKLSPDDEFFGDMNNFINKNY